MNVMTCSALALCLCAVVSIPAARAGDANVKLAGFVRDTLESARNGFANDIGILMSGTQTGYRLYATRRLGKSVSANCTVGIGVDEKALWCTLPRVRTLAIAKTEYAHSMDSVLRARHFSQRACEVLKPQTEACYRWDTTPRSETSVWLEILQNDGASYVPEYSVTTILRRLKK
jgi:hypothetical protein